MTIPAAAIAHLLDTRAGFVSIQQRPHVPTDPLIPTAFQPPPEPSVRRPEEARHHEASTPSPRVSMATMGRFLSPSPALSAGGMSRRRWTLAWLLVLAAV